MDARNWTDDAQSMDSGCDFPKIRKLGTNTVLHASTKRTREWVGGSEIRGGDVVWLHLSGEYFVVPILWRISGWSPASQSVIIIIIIISDQ